MYSQSRNAKTCWCLQNEGENMLQYSSTGSRWLNPTWWNHSSFEFSVTLTLSDFTSHTINLFKFWHSISPATLIYKSPLAMACFFSQTIIICLFVFLILKPIPLLVQIGYGSQNVHQIPIANYTFQSFEQAASPTQSQAIATSWALQSIHTLTKWLKQRTYWFLSIWINDHHAVSSLDGHPPLMKCVYLRGDVQCWVVIRLSIY